jgi:N-acetyltransferase
MTDEWQTRELDLPTYLARIDYHGPLHPAARTPANLHRAHVAAISFENLDVLLGRGISVALDRVQTKLLTSQRGGYCYEHGVLFAAVLERLGYCVDRLLARIGDKDTERPRPRTHMTLRVQAESSRWLADVGFGAGLLEPVPWDHRHAAAPRRLDIPALPNRKTTGSYASASPANGQPSTTSPRNLSTPPTSRWPTGSPSGHRAAGTGGRGRHDGPGACRSRDREHQAAAATPGPPASGRVPAATAAGLCRPGTPPLRPDTVRAGSRTCPV